MASEDTIPVLKVLIIGPSGAGKSALLLRYCDDQFDPESSTATIGIDFKSKHLAVHGKAYRLNVFDTAGQERFRTLSTSYYRGAHGVILVYDISSRASFVGMEKWIDEAKQNAAPNAVLYLVGSKLDKVAGGGRAVTYEEGQAFAEANGALFCEVSAKTKENIKRPFVEVVDQIVQTPDLLVSPRSNNTALNIGTLGSDYSSACPC
ncbi:rab protein [Apiospora kogelbergensis]|uniref:Rab protein n=1 Tax=Apiospora kogelbergensis TaxID=1337665 RepID=A0AAW0QIM9_9PEZI